MYFRRSVQVGDMLPQSREPWDGVTTVVIYTTGIYSKDSGFYNVMEHGKGHDANDIIDDLAVLLADGIGKNGREQTRSSRTIARDMLARLKGVVNMFTEAKMGELGFIREHVEDNLEIRIYAERRLI